MKRSVNNNSGSPSKRFKTNKEDDNTETLPDPFQPFLRKKATAILEHGIDASGFIQGQIRMKWPIIGGKTRVFLEVKENGHVLRFEVAFSGKCIDYFKSVGLQFSIGDEIQLSLRGASLEKLSTSRDNAIPMILKYSAGVVMRFTSSHSEGPGRTLIDTWEACDLNSANHAKGTVSNGNEPFGDDWYATPAIEPIKRDRDSRGMLHAKGPGRISPSMDLSASLPPEGDFGEAVPNHALSRLPESRTTSPPSQLPNRNVTVHRSAILTMGNSRPIAVQGTRTATNDLSFNRPSCLKPETIAPANDSTRPLFRKISRDDEAGPSKKTSSKSSPKPTTSSRGSSETKSVPAPTIDSTSGMSKKAEKATKRKAEKATKRKSEKATKRKAKRAQRLLNQILDDSAGTSNHSANVVAEGDQPAGNANALSPLSSKETAPGEAKILEAQKWMSASVSSEHTKAASTSPGNKRHSSGVPSQSEPPAEQVPGAGSSSTPDITVGDDPSLNLEAGCRVPGLPPYLPLGSLVPNRIINVIGVVVADTKLSKTKNGEYSRTLILVDPSNMQPEDLTKGFSITAFTKLSYNNVPPVKLGDILIFSGVRAALFRDKLNGSAPSFKPWTWAVFDPQTGRTMHGHSGGESKELHQPIAKIELSEVELQYCIRLADWWKSIQIKYGQRTGEESGVIVVNIDEGDYANRPRRSGRVHRLIKDASPQAPPNGFFDCTIEVLHGYKNDNGVYSLYVTDYTRNECITPVQAPWCHPKLQDNVLKVEMWEEAAGLGAKMTAGDYFFMKNVRMKVSSGGYVEGTISDGKIRRLDVDELEHEPHLADLLGRKSAWEKDTEGVAPGDEFPHWLLEEAVPEKYFRCTVQIISMSHKDDRVYIYVTDYTSRSDLAPIYIDPPTDVSVPTNSVVKVLLLDGQATTAKTLEPGDFVSVRNLRLKGSSRADGVEDNLSGKLGGDQRLIFKLQPQGTGNEDLLALLLRKETWEARLKGAAQKPILNPSKDQKLAKSRLKQPSRNGSRTISRVLQSSTCPARFRVTARVVDFYPLLVENFAVLRCTSCNEDIPARRRICTKCDESLDETHVKPFWRFFLRVEDEEGTTLEILVNNAECSLLGGLEPSDLNDDENTLRELCEKLAPVLGNLVESHRILAKDATLEPDTPLLDLIIASCPLDDDKGPCYVLMQHTVRE